MKSDYSQYQDSDRHQNYRDRKLEKKHSQKLMRGNRSVFEIEKAIVKRGKRQHDEREST